MHYRQLPSRVRAALGHALAFCEGRVVEDVEHGAAGAGPDLLDVLDATWGRDGVASWRDYLPLKHRSHYDLPFLRRFLAGMEAVVTRIRAGTLPVATCTAEELAFRYVAYTARETAADHGWWTENDEIAFSDFWDDAVLDVDVEHLFNMGMDGIENDPEYDALRFENWFDTFA